MLNRKQSGPVQGGPNCDTKVLVVHFLTTTDRTALLCSQISIIIFHSNRVRLHNTAQQILFRMFFLFYIQRTTPFAHRNGKTLPQNVPGLLVSPPRSGNLFAKITRFHAAGFAFQIPFRFVRSVSRRGRGSKAHGCM